MTAFVLIHITSRCFHPRSLRISDISRTVFNFNLLLALIASPPRRPNFLKRKSFVFGVCFHFSHITPWTEMAISLIMVHKSLLHRAKLLLAVAVLLVRVDIHLFKV